jgi:hypothetical protein
MGNGRFRLSLRIFHPTMEPAAITSIVGLQPDFFWKIGDRKRTRRGTELPETHEENYWCAELCEFYSPPSELTAELDKALDKLRGYKEFLQETRKQGGRCEFFIGWFCAPMDGELLLHVTLAGMADLGIDLALNIYAEPETNDVTSGAVETSGVGRRE